MNDAHVRIKRALISVSNKEGLVEFAQSLVQLNIEIISTGGTSKILRAAKIPVRDVAEITSFPEIMDGRVKTLHPKIHGGILGLRDEHVAIANEQKINWIDLVVVNLYPFAATVKKSDVTFDEAIENIDIGGPAMIRSAAKNTGWVGVLVDPHDYQPILEELRAHHGLTFATRKQLAIKAFTHTAHYDSVICEYLNQKYLSLRLEKDSELRYGENPHQTASAYRFAEAPSGILSAKQHQGKQLSYNNITDADAAIACVREFAQPACAVIKHANPCGVATDTNIHEAFQRAFKADALSAFGGIVALNRPCDKKIANAIIKVFVEVLIAPAYSKDALIALASKPNLRVLELDSSIQKNNQREFKFIEGGLLIQDKDFSIIGKSDLKVVTKAQPSAEEIETVLFAWPVLKHIKSNAILIAKNKVTVGVGAGQVSRVDAVDIALKKAGKNLMGAILASDAFFPFRDSIDRIANTGIRVVIQPGGSVRDEEIIAACNEYGIVMIFTGKRCFKH